MNRPYLHPHALITLLGYRVEFSKDFMSYFYMLTHCRVLDLNQFSIW